MNIKSKTKEANGGATKPPPRLCGASLLSEAGWKEIAFSLKLSPRELQTARGIFDDATQEGIAFDLGISKHTVHTYERQLLAKLGVTSRVQMVLRIVSEFLALTVSPGSALPAICRRRAKGCCSLHGG